MRKARTPEPEGFPEFWTEWSKIARHTDGRGLARECFRKHVLNGAEPQDIIDGARWFIRNLSVRDRDGFVPLSATWLNRETWADMCEKERAFQSKQQERPTNVVQMAKAALPENHFSRQYERQKSGA